MAAPGLDGPLVITLRTPRWAIWTFGPMSVLLAGGAIAWMALDPEWEAFVYGPLLLASLALVWTTVAVAQRVRGGAPLEIVATDDGLRSPLWELDWDGVERIWIGRIRLGSPRALNIVPRRPDDVRLPPSTVLRANFALSGAMRLPAIQILQVSVDVPLDELAVRFEEKAGRPLLAGRDRGRRSCSSSSGRKASR